MSKEKQRLAGQGNGNVPLWYRWGPYVSERSWGTVREDYSADGDAWKYFPFEQAHQKAYRWGEDGIAGLCDRYQIIVFAPAFWNGKDPILKERLFGLSSPEGNHGEDVKELYYYLDATPSHSYLKYLYKYPQAEFPYQLLKTVNGQRSTHESEYEILDTGVFQEQRYFDIFIEYAKVSPDDIIIKIEAVNRGDHPAPLHIIPQLWFRNQWSWGGHNLPEPIITDASSQGLLCLLSDDAAIPSPSNLDFEYRLGKRYLYCQAGAKLLFTNNDNAGALKGFSKDAFHRKIIHGEDCTNSQLFGTKSAAHYFFESIAPGNSATIYLRWCDQIFDDPLSCAQGIIDTRKQEADEFYQSIHPPHASEDERLIQRQALAGMLWNKQIYLFDVNRWLKGDEDHFSLPKKRMTLRNTHWRHLNSMRILSMPDKWEYPWFAAWDLAFHCLTYALVDLEFAKEQVWLLLFDQFQHPNGAIPAYEWEFSDLNPPVQAWAVYKIFKMEYEKTGKKDYVFLKKCYLKLLINFAFWVNKIDRSGCNVFEGGFLGLDNITIVDRSLNALGDAMLKQADGTGWMGMFCLNLMRIALVLAEEDPTYTSMATKFFQHFVYIAHAMHKIDFKQYNLWNEPDGFFYDAVVYPDGNIPKFEEFKVRSLVGLIPMYAIDVITSEELNQFPEFKKNFLWFLHNRPELVKNCVTYFKEEHQHCYVLSLIDEHQFQRIAEYLINSQEFLSPFGIRSLSKYHEQHPFIFKNLQVGYEPAESFEKMKGGNSNWRGPIWLPTNYLLIESLKVYLRFFKKPEIDLNDLADRLIAIFRLNEQGQRPFYGDQAGLCQDPHFRNYLWFNEYFHPETGKGLGASHQTGWTGLVANLIEEFRQFR
ncbi:MAG: glucosidase [Proteobacteria bacterium]|nr:glucosidase [Pseudomonadota bacterium]